MLRAVSLAVAGSGGFPFPAEVIVVAVRWYQRYGLSYPTARICSSSAG
jgi:transposase-like protein